LKPHAPKGVPLLSTGAAVVQKAVELGMATSLSKEVASTAAVSMAAAMVATSAAAAAAVAVVVVVVAVAVMAGTAVASAETPLVGLAVGKGVAAKLPHE
jgi:Na+-driven multidrug efflux pump